MIYHIINLFYAFKIMFYIELFLQCWDVSKIKKVKNEIKFEL